MIIKVATRLNYIVKNKPIFNALTLPQKIILSAVVFLIIPSIIVFSILFNIYIEDKKDNELKLLNMIDEQAMENIESYLADIENLTLQPLYDSKDIAHSLNDNDMDIISLLNGDALEDNSDLKPDGNGNLTNYTTDYLQRSIYRIMSVKKEVNSVFITNMDGKIYAYSIKNNQLYESGYNPTNEEWFKICKENNFALTIMSSTKYTYATQPMKKNDYVFPIARGIVDINTGNCVGVISIFSDIKLLRDICNKIKSSENDRILIVDKHDVVVYDTLESNISKQFDDPAVGVKELANDKKNTGKGKTIVSFTASELTDWRIVRITPQKDLFVGIRELQFKLILLFTAFILLSMALSILLVNRTMNPLKSLIKTMNVIEKGDLSVRFRITSNDEIGRLGRNFNKMIENIENLINTVYIAELRKNEAKLSALQAQINPHFIYNTLESIKMMAELNDDYNTSEMTMLLGKLLRYSISNTSEKVTVNDDLTYLKYYIKLQNYRFNNRFELKLEIDERIYPAYIFKLMFQPIVENAIFHGLANIQRRGYIFIRGYLTENGVCFTVEDNGKGMTEDELEILNLKINDFEINQKEIKSIGLKNINERIKLNYGDEYGISVQSKFNQGTTVIIELPGIAALSRN